MRSRLRAAPFLIAFLLCAHPTLAAPGSFVYVATTTCTSQCAGYLNVYDAATSALVTAIPLQGSASSIAISPDGSRVYAAESGGVEVVDTTRHQAAGIVLPAPAGRLTVSRDGRTLFITVLASGFYAYDIATQQQIAHVGFTAGPLFVDPPLSADPARDRAYWLESGACGTNVHAYDTSIGAEVTIPGASSAAFDWLDVFVSRDGKRLYLSAPGTPCGPNSGGDVRIIDLTTSTTIADLRPGSGFGVLFPRGTVDAPAAHRMLVWDLLTITAFDRDTFGKVAAFSAPAVRSMAVTADNSHAYATAVPSAGPNTLTILDLKSNAVASVVSLSGSATNVVATPPSPATNVCSYSVDTHQSSWSVNGGSGQIALTTNCSWQASSSASWARLSASSGTGSATLALTVDPNFTTTNRSATLTIGGQLVTVTQASFSATAPFGTIDTPVDNTTGVSGALSVTGWALDDVGVTAVRIYRDPVTGDTPGQQVFIGNATFVDGARPDVQAAYSSLPYASRAGWGLQVLTNMLPNQGTGTYRVYAYADDVEGHTTLLGFRAFTSDNRTATVPFGTIDTPGQGQTVSGTVVNFGWALSANVIAKDGSTIDVLVDGVVVGHPTYNNFRSDIATLFPNLPNSSGAIGYFMLDTTTLANGLHTISWVVRDSTRATQGIGSRYFSVSN